MFRVTLQYNVETTDEWMAQSVRDRLIEVIEEDDENVDVQLHTSSFHETNPLAKDVPWVVLRWDDNQCTTICEAVKPTQKLARAAADLLAAQIASRTGQGVVYEPETEIDYPRWVVTNDYEEPREDERHHDVWIQPVH